MMYTYIQTYIMSSFILKPVAIRYTDTPFLNPPPKEKKLPFKGTRIELIVGDARFFRVHVDS